MTNLTAMRTAGSMTVLLMALSACAVRPSVSYSKITTDTPASSDITDSFYLQSSLITITAGGKGDSKSAEDLIIKSEPLEYPDFKVGIATHSSWLGTVNTMVNLTKIDNTALVKSAGIETVDHRIDAIKAVGGIIATAAPLFAFAATEGLSASSLPWSAKAYVQIAENQAAADSETPFEMKNGVTLKLGKLPVDARPISQLPLASTNVFVYAACRDAELKFKYRQVVDNTATTKNVTKTFKIADPRFFQVVAFPVKGNVAMHSECGVSVTTAADGVASTFDIAGALAAQGKAIKDAIDAAKKK